MEPLLFYGVPHGCSFGAIVALEWSGRPSRLCRVEMPAQTRGALFSRINPKGKTPALLTETGTLLSESSAILHHLAAGDPARRLVGDQGSPAFDRVNQALAFLNAGFVPMFTPLWAARYMAEDDPARPVLTAFGREHVGKALDQIEAMLEGRAWLGGDARSIADAYFTGVIRWVEHLDAARLADRPRVQALAHRLEDDPAVRFAHAIEAGEDAVGAGGFLGRVTLEDVVGRLAA